MPANRSRTENWYTSLQQVASRAGSLEVALQREGAPDDGGTPAADLLWRCRLIAVNPHELLLEQPAAIGRTFAFPQGTRLVISMSIGQNRWMFTSHVTGKRECRTTSGFGATAMVVEMPAQVERCTRRSFMRVNAGALNLPAVQCWPLLDPTSVVPAETANRLAIQSRVAERDRTPMPSPGESVLADSMLLPSVGPSFPAQLLNISGGGLGLMVSQAHAAACERNTYLWLRVDLRPDVPLPVALTVRRSHSHLDSGQNVYLGLAVDFTHHEAHHAFVTQLLAGYVDRVQASQARARLAG